MPANDSPLEFSVRAPAESFDKEKVSVPAAGNPFTSADIEECLRKHGWQSGDTSAEIAVWLARVCELLGPQAARSGEIAEAESALESLLRLVFVYDASAMLKNPETQAVLAREGAREVIRELANRVLAGPEVTSERFREIIDEMKASLAFRGRELFHPIRLALAGRAGEGELDRVILLLDSASRLSFCVQVKGTHQRIIEFCAAFE